MPDATLRNFIQLLELVDLEQSSDGMCPKISDVAYKSGVVLLALRLPEKISMVMFLCLNDTSVLFTTANSCFIFPCSLQVNIRVSFDVRGDSLGSMPDHTEPHYVAAVNMAALVRAPAPNSSFYVKMVEFLKYYRAIQ